MLRIVYNYEAGFDAIRLSEVGVVALDIQVTGLEEFQKQYPNSTEEDLEQYLYDKYKDDVAGFCTKVLKIDIEQDALKYCISNYFEKLVKQTGRKPWINITDVYFERDLETELEALWDEIDRKAEALLEDEDEEDICDA